MRNFKIQELIADGASKTEMAQELADWMTAKDVVIPVYEDRRKKHRTFYQYIDRFGYWLEVDLNSVLAIAKAKTGNQWTNHMAREFKNHIKYHENYKARCECGLP